MVMFAIRNSRCNVEFQAAYSQQASSVEVSLGKAALVRGCASPLGGDVVSVERAALAEPTSGTVKPLAGIGLIVGVPQTSSDQNLCSAIHTPDHPGTYQVPDENKQSHPLERTTRPGGGPAVGEWLNILQRPVSAVFPANRIFTHCGKCGVGIERFKGYKHYPVGDRKTYCWRCHVAKGLPLRDDDECEEKT
jgi:hypothetical protein